MRKRAIASPSEGLALFDRVSGAVSLAPTMMAFSPAGSDEELAIGVGQALSILTFQGSLDPPYYRSRGEADSQGDLWFIYAKENTRFPARDSVPIASARDALNEYLSTRTLPTVITWDEV